MKLVLSNTLTRRKEELVPVHPPRVTLYTCGPTVHDYAHIGNFRTFVFFDLLRRTLRRLGYEVQQLFNLTDIEDRIIRKAAGAGVSIDAWTERYIQAFHEDRRALHIEDAEVYPRATEHIPDMLALIAELERRGHTYRSEGSVYFRIASMESYGQLSHIRLDEQRVGDRVDQDDYDKQEAHDFVLWKAAKPGEPSWDSAFGPGRPGWHIECSAMCMRYLGPTIDIHAGAVDLIFPHHENEIAQSEGATGVPFARMWLHAEFLHVSGDKMSKRLGNFYTVRDLVAAGIDPRALRYLYLTTHYRKQMSYTEDSIAQAAAGLARIENTLRRLNTEAPSADAPADALAEAIELARATFDAALADDLNLPEALAATHTLLTDINTALDRGLLGAVDHERARQAIHEFDQVLGVLPREDAAAPPEILELIARREEARRQRDWAGADQLRQQALALGWTLEDVKGAGTRYRRS